MIRCTKRYGGQIDFATVALLPGVQFSPSTQMGNDTIVSNGQSNQNNNVSVDTGYILSNKQELQRTADEATGAVHQPAR